MTLPASTESSHQSSSAIRLNYMAEQERKTWLRRRVEDGLRRGFHRAYETVKVDPDKFLLQVRAAYGLPITNFQGVYSVDVEHLDDLAHRVIRSGMKVAAAEGAGFGLGGLMTIIPDMGILSAVTLRTIQKLSLIYGFEFNTEEETAELWIAAATAAGVDISRELLEKEVVSRFVPRVIQRIAAQASREVVGKMGGTNYPACQFHYRRRPELLFRARLGRTRPLALSKTPYGNSQPERRRKTDRSDLTHQKLCHRENLLATFADSFAPFAVKAFDRRGRQGRAKAAKTNQSWECLTAQQFSSTSTESS